MQAHVETKDGRFHIKPLSVGAYGISFKTKAEAEQVTSAINAAFKRGQEDVRSSLRSLIGCGEAEK